MEFRQFSANDLSISSVLQIPVYRNDYPRIYLLLLAFYRPRHVSLRRFDSANMSSYGMKRIYEDIVSGLSRWVATPGLASNKICVYELPLYV